MNKEQIITWAKANPVMALTGFGALMLFVGITLNAGITAGMIVIGVMALLVAFVKFVIDL